MSMRLIANMPKAEYVSILFSTISPPIFNMAIILSNTGVPEKRMKYANNTSDMNTHLLSFLCKKKYNGRKNTEDKCISAAIMHNPKYFAGFLASI